MIEQTNERRRVMLVDAGGTVLAEADKLAAHEAPGSLHLAFSVFLYRSDGRLLLQRRAAQKYHFPLYWANACCSHPEPGEPVVASAERRLREELGIDCRLTAVGTFVYRAVCPTSGLVEHELDHVLLGRTDREPVPAPSEVAATCWVLPEDIAAGRPAGDHAPWLAPGLDLAEAGRSAAGW
ncbi:MAG: putative isopentenyldiphosphate isomerase [Acidimicrobiaceae bacterium]|nr:putative isopentenyldiphosphate isomerase [Acidimicrobiaceae bacterium]